MEKVQFKELAPGDRTLIDGKMETVRDLSYGDGLVSLNGNTAKPVVIEFNSGVVLRRHPKNQINIIEKDDGGLMIRKLRPGYFHGPGTYKLGTEPFEVNESGQFEIASLTPILGMISTAADAPKRRKLSLWEIVRRSIMLWKLDREIRR